MIFRRMRRPVKRSTWICSFEIEDNSNAIVTKDKSVAEAKDKANTEEEAKSKAKSEGQGISSDSHRGEGNNEDRSRGEGVELWNLGLELRMNWK